MFEQQYSLAPSRLVLRDCPNIVLPSLAVPIVTTAPASAWGAFPTPNEIVSSVGSNAVLLTQLHAGSGMGHSSTTTGNFLHNTLLNWCIYTGANPNEVAVAYGVDAIATLASINVTNTSGLSVTLTTTLARSLPVGPVLIPASTRLSVAGSYYTSDSYTAYTTNTRIYASVYDLSVFRPIKDRRFNSLFEVGGYQMLGTPAVIQADQDATTATWAGSPAYVDMLTLDEDYLFVGAACISQYSASQGAMQAEFAIDPTGGTGNEVVQARGGMAWHNTYNGAGLWDFTYPFIGYKGEKLRYRVYGQNASKTVHGIVYGIRLA